MKTLLSVTEENVFKPGLLISVILLLAGCSPKPNTQDSADTVLVGGRIYTANAAQESVRALAIRNGQIVFAGDENGAQDFIGETTEVIDLAGRMAMPGLHDIHVHPVLALERMTCQLPDQNAFNLEQLVAELRACLTRLGDSAPPDGDWITVSQFNGYGAQGKDFLGPYATIREGLNEVTHRHKLFLMGADGHVYAANDYALRHGATLHGQALPVDRYSLQDALIDYAAYFDVDAEGEPTGIIKDAGAYDLFNYAREPVSSLAARAAEFESFFTQAGVTSAQEAWADERDLDIYEALGNSGQFRVRLSVAPSVSRDRDIGANGRLNVDAFITWAEQQRTRFDAITSMRVASIKVMVDGVAEHPTQTAALKHHYLDFESESDGHLRYTRRREDCGTPPCEGLHYGLLELTQTDLSALTVAADAAGFNVHFHTIGDAAVAAALTAVEQARSVNPTGTRIHNLSHLQQVDSADIARFGPARVAITPTMSWFAPWYPYDISVIPYFDEHDRLDDLASLYDQHTPYIQKLYPVRSLRDAGALLASGSDVPVDSSVLRPFTDIMYGLLRGEWMDPPVTDHTPKAQPAEPLWIDYNREQRLPIRDLLDAYTINGARALQADDSNGSLEVGKQADFIVLNQDIIAMAETLDSETGQQAVTEEAHAICDAHYAAFCKTQVLGTWIGGEAVYRSPGF